MLTKEGMTLIDLAFGPLETVLVSDLVDDGVGGDQASSGSGSGQSQAGVDVQVGLSTTRRELDLAIGDGVGEEVVLGEGTLEGGLGGPLGGFSGEEVDGLLDGSDTSIQGGVSTVVGLVDGVRPPLWDLQSDVDCAGLVLVGNWNAVANGGNIAVEEEGKSLAGGVQDIGDGTSRAASSSPSNGFNGDLVCWWGGGLALDDEGRGGGEEGSDSGEKLHFENGVNKGWVYDKKRVCEC